MRQFNATKSLKYNIIWGLFGCKRHVHIKCCLFIRLCTQLYRRYVVIGIPIFMRTALSMDLIWIPNWTSFKVFAKASRWYILVSFGSRLCLLVHIFSKIFSKEVSYNVKFLPKRSCEMCHCLIVNGAVIYDSIQQLYFISISAPACGTITTVPGFP